MKKKLIIILLVVLAGGGYAAKTFLLPKPAVAKAKIDGEIYVLPKGFTLNLTDGRYATMTIGLILAAGQSDGATAEAASPSPSGIGTLPEEPAIRAIITNTITNEPSSALLTDSRPREAQVRHPRRDQEHDRREGDRHPLHRPRGPVKEPVDEPRRGLRASHQRRRQRPPRRRVDGRDLRRLSAVPVDLSVEIGRARMSVGETLELREGSVVTLDRMAGEPVDLLVNGTPIARGEVVVIDEQFGLRLTQVLAAPVRSEPSQRPNLSRAAVGITDTVTG